jgi:hypothetical protein
MEILQRHLIEINMVDFFDREIWIYCVLMYWECSAEKDEASLTVFIARQYNAVPF